MMNWLRRVDPAFYYKEPSLLHAQAQIARYTEAAQAEVRVRVLAEDTIVHAVTILIALATYVVVGAADHYRALFALAELDPGFTDRVVLIADSRDGQALGANAGPYQLIVPGDKREARWVRHVTDVDFALADK